MSHLVLARRFRPQQFSEVIGQEHITYGLAANIKTKQIPHALLFTGPRGVGKTSLARVFSKSLLCLNKGRGAEATKESQKNGVFAEIEPCGVCENCQEVAKGAALALWEMDGASNNSVDDVRGLIESLTAPPPINCAYKIYIIDEVHMLSGAAFNALLKSLEEPPPYTIFIFATTEPHKIPDTVISRCQRYDFQKLEQKVIFAALKRICALENFDIEDRILALIARKSQGGLRDAQSMLERISIFSKEELSLEKVQNIFGVVDRLTIAELSSLIISQKPLECLEVLTGIFQKSFDLLSFITELIEYLRNLLIIGISQNGSSIKDASSNKSILELTGFDEEEFQEALLVIAKTNSFQLQRIIEILIKGGEQSLKNDFSRFVIEATIIKAATIENLTPLTTIIQKLEHLLSQNPTSAILDHSPNIPTPNISRPITDTTTKNITTKNNLEDSLETQKKNSSSNFSSPQPSKNLTQNIASLLSEGLKVDSTNNQDTLTPPAATFPPHNSIAETIIAETISDLPKWSDFFEYLKKSGELVLAEIVRNAVLEKYHPGELKLKLNDFYLNLLLEKSTEDKLQKQLVSFTGISSWRFKFEKLELKTTTSYSGDNTQPLGTIASEQVLSEKIRIENIEEQAKMDPLVQATLTIFAGSSIERVIVKE